MAEQDKDDEMTLEITEKGFFEGHSDWVTQIIVADKTKQEGQQESLEDDKILISSSRDKTILIWKYFPSRQLEQKQEVNNPISQKLGVPLKSLHGHNHFVTDISLSQDNQFLISSSWDKTLRLWDLRLGKTSRIFQGHTKEVFTVQFSPDNRQIISAGADKGIKLWNTLADCKYTSEMNNHTDWVSCIRYSPLAKVQSKQTTPPYFVSVGWDGRIKVWNPNFQIRNTFKAHEGNINCVDISPNQKYFATGGKDRVLQVWDISDVKETLLRYDVNAPINKISFNPKHQWIAAATDKGIQIFDLILQEEKAPIATMYNKKEVKSTKKDETKKKEIYVPCTSLTWSSSGLQLYGGFANGIIKVWDIEMSGKQQS